MSISNQLPARIAAHPRTGARPASFAQRRLWFVDQFDHTGTEYNIPLAFRILGPLNETCLERALNALVERHESLRTRFVAEDGAPVQIIEPTCVLQLECNHPVMPDDDADGERVIAAAIDREWLDRFDLGVAPLFRARLTALGPDDHLLILTFHHIVFDGWSGSVLDRELSLLYGAFVESKDNPLEPLPVQFGDFSVWERNQLTDQRLEEGLSFWIPKLAGLPGNLELYSDRQRPAVQTFDADVLRTSLSSAELDAVRRVGRSNGATTYMTLLAGFAALIARNSDSDQFIVGTPVANRPSSESSALIGFFANSLALPICVPQHTTFSALLQDIRQTTLGAQRFQDIPFDYLVQKLLVRRNLSSPPLVQVVFALQKSWSQPLQFARLDVRPVPIGSRKSRTDLSLLAQQRDGGLALEWRYNRQLFERARIERMAREYRRIIDHVTLVPDRPLRELHILDDVDRARFGGAPTLATARSDRSGIGRRFEAQVVRTPDRPALIVDNAVLTYADLNATANRLARLLRTLKVGPEIPVAVYLDRSGQVVVALLAVLKAGGAYVPLDPAYPRERLMATIGDSRARVIVTTSDRRGDLSASGADIVCLDVDADRIAAEADTDLQLPMSTGHLAYVMYTSGSTGIPKGVQVDHAAIGAYVDAMDRAMPRVFTRRLLHTASFAFSSSVRQCLVPLCLGGTVVLADSHTARDPAALLRRVIDSDINTIDVVPTVLRSIVAYLAGEGAHDRHRVAQSSLSTVLCASEPLTAEVVDAWRAMVGSRISVINMYGQTETTGIVSTYPLPPSPADASGLVPVGRPTTAASAYVLDRSLQPVATGVPGDLYIQGPILARAYHGRPAQTSVTLVASPFGAPGSRMCRTGDRARYLADGTIALHGRSDMQVKVRGCRIELCDVEAAIRRIASVEHAAVVAQDLASREWRLAAYVVARDGLRPAQLHAELKKTLPDYMIPQIFELVDELPLTPNGKLDRRRLAGSVPNTAASAHREPQTLEEKFLCGAFSDLLGVDHVGLDDDFFGLGGHSLTATRLVNRIKRIGLDLSVNTIFEYPTVAELCSRLWQAEPVGTDPGALGA